MKQTDYLYASVEKRKRKEKDSAFVVAPNGHNDKRGGVTAMEHDGETDRPEEVSIVVFNENNALPVNRMT